MGEAYSAGKFRLLQTGLRRGSLRNLVLYLVPLFMVTFRLYQFLIEPGEAIVITQSGGATLVAQLVTHLYAFTE